MLTKTRELLSQANVVDSMNNLIDIRLFGSILRKPCSECNDIDVLIIVKDGNCDTLNLKLRNGINLTSQELDTVKGKGYAKAPGIFPPDALPLHVHHCSVGELELKTRFNETFKENNVSIWST
jgi:predicted nucleotidyltransferase